MQEWTATETLLYFNSHPHIEDDTAPEMVLLIPFHFNSHPHIEDDDPHEMQSHVHHNFNSHPHIEDDLSFMRLA